MLDLTKMLPPLVVVLPLCCSSVSGHSEPPRKVYGVSAESDALAEGAEDAKAVEQQEIKVAAAEPLGGVKPIKDAKKVTKSHAPFESGECGMCHKNNDPKKPGPVNGDINELCLQCHDAIGDKMKKMPTLHPAVEDSCTNCHNPHNSTEPHLLRGKITTLCFECHEDTMKQSLHAKVQHDAVLVGKACLNCHDPHATQVEHLLLAAPFDLCISCHGDDTLKDDKGEKLTNFKKLLKENPSWHAPVQAKDCSACHKPHGSEVPRLLKKPYPEKFYAPYEPANYALCFQCHNDQIMANAETTTLTSFRDGSKNLHYLHVNMADRGRTCRACHDVHAATNSHLVRKGVPYGSSGWTLPINFKQTPTGGSCAKTCHATKTYTNRSTPRPGSKKKTKRSTPRPGSKKKTKR